MLIILGFGITDPIYNNDIGYYFFLRAFYIFLTDYFSILILGMICYTVVYYLFAFNVLFNELDRELLKKCLLVKQTKINVLMLAVVQAIKYYFKSQDILYGYFTNLNEKLVGAGFIDVKIFAWGYRILPIIIILSVFIGISLLSKKKYKKGIVSFSILPIYFVAMYIIAWGFAFFGVNNSNELDSEKQYVKYNIEYTKRGYNIDIEENEINLSLELTDEVILKSENSLKAVDIVDKELVLSYLNEYCTEKGYYEFTNCDLKVIDGKSVYLCYREINSKDNRTYLNKRYEYTHGYGIIAIDANEVNEKGLCKTIEDLDLFIKEPRIYYGIDTDNHVIVNANNIMEKDYEVEGYSYSGNGGLSSIGFIDRLLLGIKHGDFRMIFSSNINKDSKILFNRNIIQRAKKVAPFLEYDENPYAVVSDEGRIIWVLDAYTTSDLYPYSQYVTIKGNKRINYIRNSVKVLVDSFDGTMKFYITDRNDPVIRGYEKAYPTLFQNIDTEELPDYVWDNVKYPEFLFNIQAQILQKYHESETEIFYRADDKWSIALEKEDNVKQTMKPFYGIDNNDSNRQTLNILFTQENRQNIIAYLSTVNNKEEYGKLKLYTIPKEQNILGLSIIDKLEEELSIKNELKLWNSGGYKITKKIKPLILEGSLLYVIPVKVTPLNEASKVPEIKKIIVTCGDKIAIADDLNLAVEKIVSQSAVKIEIKNTDDLNSLIEEIIKANKNVKESTQNSDFEMMGKDLKSLQELIDKLEIMQKETQNAD